MPTKTRKRFTPQEKLTILRLHLLEHSPVSDLCDRHGIHPTMFYRWQKEFFENGAASLERRSEKAADRGRDPSADPGAKTGGGQDAPPFGSGIGMNALNPTKSLDPTGQLTARVRLSISR